MKHALALVLLCLSITTQAQQPTSQEPDPYAFSTRTYRLPSDELVQGFVTTEKGKLRSPALPPASASAGEVEIFLKRSHDVMKEYLHQQGITLPPGSLACYDPDSGTLSLRAMAVVHDLVGALSEVFVQHLPYHLAWTLDILEAPASDVRATMASCAGKSDHSAAYDALLPKAIPAVAMRGETKPGTHTRARTGSQIDDTSEYTTDAKQRVSATQDSKPLGTSLEIDPVVGPDGKIIDVNLRLTHRYASPTTRWQPLTAGSAAKIEARWQDTPLAEIATNFSLFDNTTQLLGIWTLEAVPEPARVGLMQAAFLRMAVVKSQPLVDPRVEPLLTAHGEKVVPTPKGVRPVADPTLPPGMIVRRYRVPPDFSSLNGDPAPAAPAADPFAGGAAANEPRFTRRVTVEEILKSQGIPFPEGSSANYVSISSQLVVRNTPANQELVETFLDTLRDKAPRQIALTLHVVQGEGALLRKLARDTLVLPDHRAAWQAVEAEAAQGKARYLRTLWLTTKSGSRAMTQNVIEHQKCMGLEFAQITKGEATKATEDNKAGASAKAIILGQQDNGILISAEMEPVGLKLEVDPVVGTDGKTIDITASVDYDTAPPTLLVPTEPAADGTQRLAVPETQFYQTDFITSTPLLSGTTRLLSIWKPTGSAEFNGDVMQAAFLTAEIIAVEAVK